MGISFKPTDRVPKFSSHARTSGIIDIGILNKSKRLLKIKNEIDNNVNIDQVLSSFKPPIFWKEKDIVKKQAQSWSTNQVKEIIFKINDLEALVKKNTSNSMLFVSNFVSNY